MEFITVFFSDTVLHALGWTVVHSLWQGTLLAILLSVLMMALEKRSARLRYEVACGAMFTMLMMALATFIIYLDQDPNLVEVTVALMGSSSNPSITIVAGESNFLQTNFQTVIAFFDAQLPLIVNVWLIGFLFFAFRMAGGFIHLRQLRHRDTFPADKMLQNKLNQLIQRTPLRRSVKIMESAMIKVPILLGHLKPLILIPIGTINLLTEEEVEAVLAHELAHIIRRDFSMNIFFTLVEILFYYHPGVWLMSATVRSERENCCDDLALFLCKNPLVYARALYKLEAAHKAARLPGLALSFSSQKNQLLHRVRRILNQPQNKSNIMEKLMATSFLLLTIAILSIGATTPLDELHARRVITTGVETLNNPVVLVEANSFQALNIQPKIMVLDTIPVKKQDRRKIIKTENGRAIEITIEDGQISDLKIDGKEIPADEYDQHEKLVQEMVVEFDNIPTPPTPPQMITDIPAPPSPPAPPTIRQYTVGDRTVTVIDEDTEIVISDHDEETLRKVEKQMEEHHKQMEKHHKEMEKHHKKIEVHRKEIMEEHQLKMEEHREKIALQQKEMQEKQKERMEKHQLKMEEHREKMEIKRIEMQERMEEIVAESKQIIAENIAHAGNEINVALEDQLIADGLIDSRENYKLELSGKKLKVNGKTQSDAMHQKYLQLYADLSGDPISAKSKIKIVKSKF